MYCRSDVPECVDYAPRSAVDAGFRDGPAGSIRGHVTVEGETERTESMGNPREAASAMPADVREQPNPRVDEDDRERTWLRQISHAADREAFRQLYVRYYARLIRFLSRVTRNRSDVEEIINDTLLIVWRQAGAFRGASRVSTWILGIAYRCALKTLRKTSARLRLSELALQHGEELVEDVARETEERQLLDIALSSLPPEQRLVLVLVYCMGYSCEETAEIAECPVNTVKTRMFHARNKVRAILSTAGE